MTTTKAPTDSDASDFDHVAEALRLPPAATPVWKPRWHTTQASFDPTRLFFLESDFVAAACARLRMAGDVRDACLETLPLIRGQPLLQRLAWHCHCLMFDSPGLLQADVRAWPLLPRELGPMADMFLGVVFLSGLPYVENLYRRRGIPESIMLATLQDLELWICEHRRKHGVWGFSEHKWLIHHFAGNLFRLGRLQFQFSTMGHDYHAFRRRRGRTVLVLAGHGMRFARDGRMADAEPGAAAPGVWSAEFCETMETICGNPISPEAKAYSRVVTLRSPQWRRILGRGDPTLAVHIPAGGPLTPAACGGSFRQALGFFARYYPERPVNAFTCVSWFLDPQFETCLDGDSNIVRFQREVYLVPAPGADGRQAMERVFGGPVTDLSQAPRETSLQRTMLRHLERGGQWRSGGLLAFPDDLEWGRQTYRRRGKRLARELGLREGGL